MSEVVIYCLQRINVNESDSDVIFVDIIILFIMISQFFSNNIPLGLPFLNIQG